MTGPSNHFLLSLLLAALLWLDWRKVDVVKHSTLADRLLHLANVVKLHERVLVCTYLLNAFLLFDLAFGALSLLVHNALKVGSLRLTRLLLLILSSGKAAEQGFRLEATRLSFTFFSLALFAQHNLLLAFFLFLASLLRSFELLALSITLPFLVLTKFSLFDFLLLRGHRFEFGETARLGTLNLLH